MRSQLRSPFGRTDRPLTGCSDQRVVEARIGAGQALVSTGPGQQVEGDSPEEAAEQPAQKDAVTAQPSITAMASISNSQLGCARRGT